MPARTAFAPRTGPIDWAILRDTRLPNREVSHRLFGILVRADAFTNTHLLQVQVGQLAVAGAAGAILLDAEIHGLVWGLVSKPAFYQLIDQFNDGREMVRRAWRVVRTQTPERAEVVKKRCFIPPRIVAQRFARSAHPGDDLVLHVR